MAKRARAGHDRDSLGIVGPLTGTEITNLANRSPLSNTSMSKTLLGYWNLNAFAATQTDLFGNTNNVTRDDDMRQRSFYAGLRKILEVQPRFRRSVSRSSRWATSIAFVQLGVHFSGVCNVSAKSGTIVVVTSGSTGVVPYTAQDGATAYTAADLTAYTTEL